MKKPKYFKGAKRKKKEQKEPVVERSVKKRLPKAEFPKNSRAIPERPHKKQFFLLGEIEKLRKVKRIAIWLQVWNIGAIIVLFLIGGMIMSALHTLSAENAQRQAVIGKLNQWEGISKTHPGYRDAYIQMASLSYELGDTNQALAYVEKALSLDPNNDTAVKLETLIAGKGK